MGGKLDRIFFVKICKYQDYIQPYHTKLIEGCIEAPVQFIRYDVENILIKNVIINRDN